MRGNSLLNKLKSLDWTQMFHVALCVIIIGSVFWGLRDRYFNIGDAKSLLGHVLTIHSIFSAILLTYLFSNLTWTKERKLDAYKEAVQLSQKLTSFRRILYQLTSSQNYWNHADSTINLIDSRQFEKLDFCDFIGATTEPEYKVDKEIVNNLTSHEDFNNITTALYLAAVSIVYNRKNLEYGANEELYKSVDDDKIYDLKIINKWIDKNVFGHLWNYWNQNIDFIKFEKIDSDKREIILREATKIDSRFHNDKNKVSNKLLEDISNDFSNHYLDRLQSKLFELKMGLDRPNLLVLKLVTVSLIFGILIPFILILLNTPHLWFNYMVSIVVSVNTGIILYLILRFPSLINHEIKWFQ